MCLYLLYEVIILNLLLITSYIADTLAGHDVFDSTTVTNNFSAVDIPSADDAVEKLRGLSVGIPLVYIIIVVVTVSLDSSITPELLEYAIWLHQNTSMTLLHRCLWLDGVPVCDWMQQVSITRLRQGCSLPHEYSLKHGTVCYSRCVILWQNLKTHLLLTFLLLITVLYGVGGRFFFNWHLISAFVILYLVSASLCIIISSSM